MQPHLNTIIAIILLLSAHSLMALPDDDHKPLKISSETATIDLANGIATHQGDVLVDQGSRHMRGETLKIYRNKAGKLQKVTLAGNPAHYQAQPKADKPKVLAQASQIIYDAIAQILTLKDHAVITQGQDKASGPELVYHVATQTITSKPLHGERTTLTIESDHNILPSGKKS